MITARVSKKKKKKKGEKKGEEQVSDTLDQDNQAKVTLRTKRSTRKESWTISIF